MTGTPGRRTGIDLRVTDIETTVVDLPLRRPHQFAGHAIDRQAYLLVRLRTDAGVEGVGEGVSPGGPWWGGESVEGQQQMVERYLAPALLGADVLDLHAARAAMDRVAYGNEFAKSAVETALTDAAARARGVPAHVLVAGGATRTSIPVRWALSGLGGAEVAAEAADRLAQGHRSLKLKMGALDPADDVRRVAELIEKIGADIDYLADPNGTWSFRTAVWAVRELEAMGVRMVEQPLHRADLPAMAALGNYATSALLLADEAVCGPGDALAAIAARACDAVAIKPGKAGGLRRAADVAAISTAAGLACYGGTALETSIGTAAAAHLFAGLAELPLGCELIGPLLLDQDLTVTPVRYQDGQLLLPDGPGLGVEVDWDVVARHRRPAR
ncbi:muconate/chloromuconate family cycloisomerase [Amycolatopsis sp. NPDC004378]